MRITTRGEKSPPRKREAWAFDLHSWRAGCSKNIQVCRYSTNARSPAPFLGHATGKQNRILHARRGRRDILDPRYAYKGGTDHEFMGVRASIQSCRSACGICTYKWHDA